MGYALFNYMYVNDLHLYEPSYVESATKSWWWVQDDTYVISFGLLPGYKVVESRPFERWMPARAGSIYALKKLSP